MIFNWPSCGQFMAEVSYWPFGQRRKINEPKSNVTPLHFSGRGKLPAETAAELGNQLLIETSGGATAKLFSGSYKTDGNEYVSEPVIELEAWMTAAEFLANLSALIGFFELILRELNQESLFFVIDNTARLLSLKK